MGTDIINLGAGMSESAGSAGVEGWQGGRAQGLPGPCGSENAL